MFHAVMLLLTAASHPLQHMQDPQAQAGPASIHSQAYRKAPAVKRNAIVEVIYENGPLTIRSQGRALNSGEVGDRILIMNMRSHNTFSALIAGKDKAVVR